jgi:peptidyl-prolyl cis-trans isomerase D
VKAYYEKNAANFEVPEAVKAEYVILNAEALAAQVSVNDTEINEFYKANAKQFTTEEQRSARHILIAASEKAAPADKEKARKSAGFAGTDPQKSGFAKLAKENSDDPGSKEAGGDLGVVAKNAMVKPFEDAVFRLKKDEISDLVQTQYGYHIIQLTSLSAGSVKPLAEVKDQIVADIKKQKQVKHMVKQ